MKLKCHKHLTLSAFLFACPNVLFTMTHEQFTQCRKAPEAFNQVARDAAAIHAHCLTTTPDASLN
jgi:hypothetical protein